MSYRIQFDVDLEGASDGGVWRPRTPSDPDSIKIGVHIKEAQGLRQFLSHYPWIVHIGVSAWRKMAIHLAPSHQSLSGATGLLQRHRGKHNPEGPMELLAPIGSFSCCLSSCLPKRRRTTIKALLASDRHFKYYLSKLISGNQIDCMAVIVKQLAMEPDSDVSLDFQRVTALHFACSATLPSDASATLVKLFLDAGFDPIAKDNSGSTPLHHAAQRNYPAVQALLASGKYPNVDVETNFRNTPLKQAASCGNVDAVKLLLCKGANVGLSDPFGMSSIHNAVCGGDLETVRLVLEHGGDVNAQDKNALSPLHYAVFSEEGEPNMGIIKLLLASGADVDATDSDGQTPLAATGSEAVKTLLGPLTGKKEN